MTVEGDVKRLKIDDDLRNEKIIEENQEVMFKTKRKSRYTPYLKLSQIEIELNQGTLHNVSHLFHFIIYHICVCIIIMRSSIMSLSLSLRISN